MADAHDPTALLVVFTTVPDAEVAGRIARALVAGRVAACVQALPGVRSTYRWEGRLEETSEVLLLSKTTRARLPDFERVLQEAHPYSVPEIVAVEAARVAAPYRAWVVAETS
ncbi:MAG: divalent-cation tolerance protein CutA [Planctomycetes bacterium]|nr:divalent-cation tolerance protein CutA [Planctomycetota bacterium]